MDYEKKYKEALEKARQLCAYPTTKPFISDLQNLFPELAESKDERIRKELINAFKEATDSLYIVLTPSKRKTFIAWLEKQGEPSIKWNKNTEGNKPQINRSVLMKTIYGIAEGEWKGEHWLQYRWSGSLKDSDVLAWIELSDLEKQGEQKPVHPHKEMETERWKEACKAACVDSNYRSHYCLTETRDDYFVDGVQWADENPKQKPAEWSEEDENIRQWIISDINKLYHLDKKSEFLADREINWLKSLRPHSAWKPSEEQMAVLNEVINYAANSELQHWSSFIYTLLRSLREQLKKLREE